MGADVGGGNVRRGQVSGVSNVVRFRAARPAR